MEPTSTSSTSSERASLERWASRLTEPDEPERAPYRTYRATFCRIAEAIAASPRARAYSAGDSVRGEPIWTLVVEPDQPPELTVFVLAGLHAMEHVGVATAVALLGRAVSPATPWRRRRLVILPMANPDGFLEVERGLACGRRRFWRKNAHGVDLNRNFATRWDDRYYLTRLLPRIYAPGPAPLSEPESRAVDAVFAEHAPRLAVSLHAFGRWIYLPYAGSAEVPPDLARLEAIGRAMAERQPHGRYRVRQLGRHSRFFAARGAEIDHFYERGALSFLIEIGAGPRLADPRTWTLPYAWFSPPAPLLERDVDNVVPAVEALAEVDPGSPINPGTGAATPVS